MVWKEGRVSIERNRSSGWTDVLEPNCGGGVTN